MLSEDQVDAFVSRYVKDGQVVSIGTNQLGELFLKKLGLWCEQNKWNVEIIPTSTSQISTANQFHLPLTTLNDREVDVAIEFATQADHDYDFIKGNTTSLIRDKMIAQSAGELIVVVPAANMYDKLKGMVPYEISAFGWKRTLLMLEQVGRVDFTKYETEPPKTELGHYIVETEMDDHLLIDEMDQQARLIPGVLETGFFIGSADRILMVGDQEIKVKSRMEYGK